MASLNQVQIIGNLGKDPEVRFMPSGDAVVNVSVATSESWKDKQTGDRKEATEWHNVVVFGKLAEIVGQYLKKGSKVFFQGKLRTRKWEKDGVDRYSTEIVVDAFGGKLVMLSTKDAGASDAGSSSSPSRPASAPAAAPASQEPFEDDDIPF